MKFYNKEENQRHLQICIEIERHLIKKGLLPKREWFLILDHEDHIIGLPRYEITVAEKARKNKYRNPDIIWIDSFGLWILEIDGLVHYIKSGKTSKRNNIYENNNCNFIILETFELKENSSKIINKPMEKLISELDCKISEIKRKEKTL